MKKITSKTQCCNTFQQNWRSLTHIFFLALHYNILPFLRQLFLPFRYILNLIIQSVVTSSHEMEPKINRFLVWLLCHLVAEGEWKWRENLAFWKTPKNKAALLFSDFSQLFSLLPFPQSFVCVLRHSWRLIAKKTVNSLSQHHRVTTTTTIQVSTAAAHLANLQKMTLECAQKTPRDYSLPLSFFPFTIALVCWTEAKFLGSEPAAPALNTAELQQTRFILRPCFPAAAASLGQYLSPSGDNQSRVAFWAHFQNYWAAEATPSFFSKSRICVNTHS